MKKIICIGSATKDVFLGVEEGVIIDNPKDMTAQKLLAFEFGAKIYAQSFREELGGSAVNVASGLWECRIKPFVFSRSSKSQTGKWIQKQIGKRKLKKNYLQQTGGTESEVAVVISERKHKDHVIFRTGDSVVEFNVEKALSKFREKVDWIYVGSQKKGWIEDMEEIIAFSKKKKASVAINPSGYQIEENAKKLLEVMKEIQIVFMNKDEVIEVIQNAQGEAQDDIEFLALQMRKYCPNVVVITDGANGAYVIDEKEILHVPTQAKRVVDTVGAGDAFSSAFLACYVFDQDPKKALAWGIANSGGVISKEGAVNGLLKTAQLEEQQEKIFKQIKTIEQ